MSLVACLTNANRQRASTGAHRFVIRQSGAITGQLGKLLQGMQDIMGNTASRRDELIRAIIESPADDDLRLVFADYLEETGDPRAELVRIPYLLQGLSEFSRERQALLTRQRILLRDYGPFLSPPPATKVFQMRGGFIEGLEMTCHRFLTHKEKLFQLVPLREVCLSGKRGKLSTLAKWPGLRKLERLRLNIHNNSESDLIWMLNSPHLDELRELEVYGMEMGPLAFNTLCQHSKLRGVRRLATTCPFSSTALQQISRSPVFRDLEDLVLIGDSIYPATEPETPPPLATDGALAGLRSVRLPAIQDEHLETLARCSGATLHTLQISPRYSQDPSLWAKLPMLRRLQVMGGQPDAADAVVSGLLAALEQCQHLQRANFSANYINDEQAARIASHPSLSRLRRLSLRDNRIGLAGADALAASPHRHPRSRILLGGNPIDEDGEDALADRHGRSRLDFRSYDIPRSEFIPR